jgi:plasmid maintenance system antidote protein VapI
MEHTEYSFEDYPLGVNEIAEVLGVKPATVTQWQRRLLLPKPDASINKGRTKLWKNKTVVDWANATGRNLKKQSYETTKETLIGLQRKWDVLQDNKKTIEGWNVWKSSKDFGQWEDLGKKEEE